MLNPDFNRMLRRRKLTIDAVAGMIFSNPKAVTLVLGGLRAGTPTWRKLAAVLSKEEYDCAHEFAGRRRAEEVVPAASPFRRNEGVPTP